jgi:hypothetical protein
MKLEVWMSEARDATWIDGNLVGISKGGTLFVQTKDNKSISVLKLGTHAALNVLGEDTKKKVVVWWNERK